MIHRAGVQDFDFLRRAQAANGDLEQFSDEEIFNALGAGLIEYYILERPDAKMGVGVLRGFAGVTLVAWYREGCSSGLTADAVELLSYVRSKLNPNDRIGLDVHMSNPLYDKLVRFYRRLGFKESATRMTLGGVSSAV